MQYGYFLTKCAVNLEQYHQRDLIYILKYEYFIQGGPPSLCPSSSLIMVLFKIWFLKFPDVL